ncbi:Endoplasmic reticulum mannosyl-oligosaccharide 1,2-alpha-mannosidase [Cladobotryum mycophilum]|uniref:alpha-1,2-Mannosidase n=1 Tax=Cladobotryum mycophilum TaxID=491253 RepID=A0ABR0SV92_9HYPO
MFRRRRMFAVLAVIIIYMLYHVAHNTWDDPSKYKPVANLHPHSDPQAAPQAGSQAAAPPSTDKGPLHQDHEVAKSNKDESEKSIEKVQDTKDAGPAEHKAKKTQNEDSDWTLADIYPKNPPKASIETPPRDNVVPKVHWKPMTEFFPVPAKSVKWISPYSPLKILRIQHQFGTETLADKTKRVERQIRVTKEIERAWAGYKKHAWMHDELSPVSGKFRDPFCGWAATLIDSLDTIWIAGLRDEFEQVVKAVKDIDFTTTQCNSIPVFETTIRYLGGILGALDVSGGPGGNFPFLLDKAVELADVLMGAFDTPNRMPILYYQWKPEYASQPHRAGTVSIAELGTLSLEFSRLAQITNKNKYYDAIDRITDALVEMQKSGTALPGLFPETVDASGCNRTAIDQESPLSKAAQMQLKSDELSKKPNGYVIDKIRDEKSENKGQAPHPDQDQSSGFVVGKIQQDIEGIGATPDLLRKARARALLDFPPRLASNGKEDGGFIVGKIQSENEGSDGNNPHQPASKEKGGFVVGKIRPETEENDGSSARLPTSKEKEGGFVVGKIRPENEGGDGNGARQPASNGKQDGFVVGKIQPEKQDGNSQIGQADARRKVGEFIVGKIQPESPDNADQPRQPASNQPPKKSDGFVVGKLQTEEVSGSNAAGIRRRDEIPVKDESPKANQVYHIAGGQDSAYEYFPKAFVLLGGFEVKYEKLWKDAVKGINEWLLYRPMIKDDRDILFPARVTTRGDPKKDLTATFEITHLSCFLGGMYAMGGKIFGQKKDIEIAKKLTDGCVWAYETTASGIMPESAEIVPCPTLEKCEFNETLWWEKLDPSGKWREKRVAEWEEETAKRGLERLKQQQETAANSDGIDQVKDNAAESLRQAAKGSSGNVKSHRKRAAVPAQGDKKDATGGDPNVGSELPQALKDRIGWKTEEKEEKKGKAPAPKSGSQRDDDQLEKKPAVLNSVLEANRLPPLPPKAPGQAAFPPKPLSHEEFVKGKIEKFKLPPGFTSINNPSYLLRPEAIESVFYLYRITGDPIWMEKGWRMFEATIRATRTEIANSAIDNVMKDEPELKDEMESFWLAETLKYYYLLFADPETISLDDFVFNTEAHPLRRPR